MEFSRSWRLLGQKSCFHLNVVFLMQTSWMVCYSPICILCTSTNRMPPAELSCDLPKVKSWVWSTRVGQHPLFIPVFCHRFGWAVDQCRSRDAAYHHASRLHELCSLAPGIFRQSISKFLVLFLHRLMTGTFNSLPHIHGTPNSLTSTSSRRARCKVDLQTWWFTTDLIELVYDHLSHYYSPAYAQTPKVYRKLK